MRGPPFSGIRPGTPKSSGQKPLQHMLWPQREAWSFRTPFEVSFFKLPLQNLDLGFPEEVQSSLATKSLQDGAEEWLQASMNINSTLNKYFFRLTFIFKKETSSDALQLPRHRRKIKMLLNRVVLGFPGGSVVKSLPAKAGDLGLIPGLGRSHMPQSSWAHAPKTTVCSGARERQPLHPRVQLLNSTHPHPAAWASCRERSRWWEAHAPQLERSPPHSLQLEKSPHSNKDPKQPQINK